MAEKIQNLIIEADKLLSRKIRKTVTSGAIKRKLNLSSSLVAPNGNVFSLIWNGLGKLVGFISSVLQGIKFSVSAIWGWVVGRIEAVKQFNWNATDKELEAKMQAQNVGLASTWGSVAGQTVGWTAGIVIGAGVGLICPVIGGGLLAAAIATAVANEAAQELLPALTQALTQTANVLASKASISLYINYRKFLKNANMKILTKIYGKQTAEFIKNEWGQEGGPQMSFNNYMDETIESLSGGSEVRKAFLENFAEEAWDSFIEAGFIIAEELDKGFAENKLGRANPLGQNRIVKVTPDERTEESFTLAGPERIVIAGVSQALATSRMLSNRDVGTIIGQPAPEALRGQFQLRKLHFIFRAKEKPPWIDRQGKQAKKSEVSVPNVKRGLTWQEIKTAAKPYNSGPWRISVNLDDGHSITLYAASEEEGKGKIRELLVLTTAKPVGSWHVSKDDPINPKHKKEIQKMWPCYATLLNRKNTIDGQGRIDLAGRTFEEKLIRIDLWPETEPIGLKPLQ